MVALYQVFRDANAVRALFALSLGFLLFIEPCAVNVSGQRKRLRAQRSSKTSVQAPPMTEDQQIAHILSRLTFGARQQDFARIKQMGVEAFIKQQLDPDTIDDATLEAKLAKLPTLSLPTPALNEYYNSPKPLPAPTPTPAAPQNSATAPAALAVRETQSSSQPNGASVQTSVTPQMPSADAQKAPAQQNSNAAAAKKSDMKKSDTNTAAPKASATPMRNPQQVVLELQRAAILRAVYSERQLQEVLVNFWENHFSIYSQKDADRIFLTSFDRDAIRPYALGRFRDLLGAVARSPAMLYYLDNWQSSVLRHYPAAKGKPARTTGGINENYARELMELHTLGVDGGYTQKDVQEVARCFTGWTIYKPNTDGLFVFNPAAHDNGEKVALGQKIPAGGGLSDAERVLDILARHPSTAHFIATKLARHFISDDPPASVINRAADVFLKTDGSIHETLRAIITSPEFFAQSAYRAKTRSPFEYAAAALRALNAETDGTRPLLDWIGRMGQPVFGRITPDGYPDRADQWLSTGALLERFNFASALATNKIKGTSVDLARTLADVDVDDPRSVATHLAQNLLGDNPTPQTKRALERVATEAAQNQSQSRMMDQPMKAVNTAQQTKPALALIVTNGANRAYVQNAWMEKAGASNKSVVPSFVSELVTLMIGAPEFQRR